MRVVLFNRFLVLRVLLQDLSLAVVVIVDFVDYYVMVDFVDYYVMVDFSVRCVLFLIMD